MTTSARPASDHRHYPGSNDWLVSEEFAPRLVNVAVSKENGGLGQGDGPSCLLLKPAQQRSTVQTVASCGGKGCEGCEENKTRSYRDLPGPPVQLLAMSERGRERATAYYAAARNYPQLLDILAEVVQKPVLADDRVIG